MIPISQETMRQFVEAALKRLTGDWVIIGGAVLPLLGVEARITVDIDLAGPDSASQKDVLALMEIAESLGLPIESINQAGAFFLHKIEGWQKSLVEIGANKRARVFRPDVNLFLRLKIARLSQADLSDCLEILAYAKKAGEAVTKGELLAIIKERLRDANDARAERLEKLQERLKDF